MRDRQRKREKERERRREGEIFDGVLVMVDSRGVDLYTFGWAIGPPILSTAPQ